MSDATNWPDKTIIGLTGNIATGKSTVLRLAAEKSALILDADKIVHELMDDDPGMQAAIAVAFGEEVRRSNGTIDRRKLGAIVFNDKEAMRDLELMIHPAVGHLIRERITASARPIVMIEAIHLLQGDLAGYCNYIWVTRCRRQRQLDRLVVCRGLAGEDARQRVEMQPPQEAKVARADVVIDTDGTLADTVAQFELAWSRLPQVSTPPKPPPAPIVGGTPAAAPPRATTPAIPVTAVAATGATRAPTGATNVTPATVGPPAQPPDPEQYPDVTVRRARPSDVPALLLLIHRATDGRADMKRTDLLLALSERGYLIGQQGTEISAAIGWTATTTTSVIEQIYVHPLEATAVTGAALLVEAEKSASELLSEVLFVFLPADAPPPLVTMFTGQGYTAVGGREGLPRVWRRALEESQTMDSVVYHKVLRARRIA